MQQSSATPKKQDVGIVLRKIVAYSHSSSQCLLVYTYSFLHGVIPTSYFILMIFILVLLIFYQGLALTVARGEMILPRTSM